MVEIEPRRPNVRVRQPIRARQLAGLDTGFASAFRRPTSAAASPSPRASAVVPGVEEPAALVDMLVLVPPCPDSALAPPESALPWLFYSLLPWLLSPPSHGAPVSVSWRRPRAPPRRFPAPSPSQSGAGSSPSGELEHVTLFSFLSDRPRTSAGFKPFEELLEEEESRAGLALPPAPAPALPPPQQQQAAPMDADEPMEDKDCCILSQDFFWPALRKDPGSSLLVGLADTAVHGVALVGGTAFSCRGLFWLLRLVSAVGLSRECRHKLEGLMLDQATLDDLLVSCSGDDTRLIDCLVLAMN